MQGCALCEKEASTGLLCRSHALALATCSDITGEQICAPGSPTRGDGPRAWLLDQWGRAHLIRPGLGIGLVVGNAITAMARQPESAAMVRTTMFLGVAFTEALALIGFVVFILLNFA